MAKVWYCAVVADDATPVRPPAGKLVDEADTMVCPFGVSAETHYEAVGKAMAVKNRLRKQHPRFKTWLCHVNENCDGSGLVVDPTNAALATTSLL